jgi:hypothetical protein
MSQHAGNATRSSHPGVGPRLLPGAEARRARPVTSLRAGDYAWLTIAAGVVGYEIAASSRNYELLSEAVDRYRILYPFVTNLTIAYLAAHLLRIIPRRVDPLYLLATRWTRRAP